MSINIILLIVAIAILFVGSGVTLSAAMCAVADHAPKQASENDVDPDMLAGLVKAFIWTYHIVSVVCILAVALLLFGHASGLLGRQ